MINYITSLPLLSDHEGVASREEQAGQVMQDTIDFLNEVDMAWRTVLRGNAWVVDPSNPESGKAVRVNYAGTVGQTERSVLILLKVMCVWADIRIRLRSIVMTGRAKILAWARSYGSFPGAALGSNGAQTPTRNAIPTGDWEMEIMGLWNGILDSLSRAEGEAEEADERDPEDES
jgi:hypothetical protein